jgi:hypothetical protein
VPVALNATGWLAAIGSLRAVQVCRGARLCLFDKLSARLIGS